MKFLFINPEIMHEGQPNNDIEVQKFRNEKFEEYRKEILAFNDLPESKFLNMRDNMGTKLEPQEARSLLAHGIMQRIDNEARNGIFDQQLHFELVHLWEKEIMGLTEKRTMYDGEGNVI